MEKDSSQLSKCHGPSQLRSYFSLSTSEKQEFLCTGSTRTTDRLGWQNLKYSDLKVKWETRLLGMPSILTLQCTVLPSAWHWHYHPLLRTLVFVKYLWPHSIQKYLFLLSELTQGMSCFTPLWIFTSAFGFVHRNVCETAALFKWNLSVWKKEKELNKNIHLLLFSIQSSPLGELSFVQLGTGTILHDSSTWLFLKKLPRETGCSQMLHRLTYSAHWKLMEFNGIMENMKS